MNFLRCCFWLLLSTATLVAQTAEASFRIGTWNLEFLGGAPQLRRDTPPRTDDDMAAIGKKIVELGVVVLAVQEINGEPPLRQVANAAGKNWQVLLGTSGGWDDGKNAQNIGFLYDSAAVDLLHAEELLTLPRLVDGVPIFHRVPVTACFRHKLSGCDFRLVTVHLKAGQKALDEQKRQLEATLLQQWLATQRQQPNEDRDVVVLGDFNCGYDAEPRRVFERDRQFAYVVPTTPQPTILHFDEPIDQIVAASDCQELDGASFAVHGVRGDAERLAWRQTYSDHFPVTISLRCRGDDDPDSVFGTGPADQALPTRKRPAPTQSAGATPSGWPPAPGSAVRVRAEPATFEGTLLLPIPDGPGGWIVLETSSGRVALPMAAVQAVHYR